MNSVLCVEKYNLSLVKKYYFLLLHNKFHIFMISEEGYLVVGSLG
jgi:hypothetical protein